MKIFQREQRSLFGEILDWMLTPLLLLWPVSLVLTWLVAQTVAGRPYDRSLENHVQVLSDFVVIIQGKPALALASSAREVFKADESDTVYFQVLDDKGRWVAGERDLPVPPEPHIEVRPLPTAVFGEVKAAPIGQTLLRDDAMREQEVRVAYMWFKPAGWRGAPLLIQVAETREKRALLGTEIIKGVMVPQFILLPMAVVLVWFALIRGIRPLHQLERRIRSRRSDDLSPLETKDVPQEVSPFVLSINDLLSRQSQALAGQKRFLADAAHQLKTPLAGLRMQAELALRENASPEDLRQSLTNIGHSSRRATHTVNQLLLLARAEGLGEAGNTLVQRSVVNLSDVAVDALQDTLAAALAKDIDLGFEQVLSPTALGVQSENGREAPSEAAPQTSPLMGNAALLKEMVRNLIENAINYTPAGGKVTVRVTYQAPRWLLVVEDNGSGIAPEERQRVLEPFYRSLNNDLSARAEGSGLGLAIVQRIASAHGAQLSLDYADTAQAKGTLAQVTFG